MTSKKLRCVFVVSAFFLWISCVAFAIFDSECVVPDISKMNVSRATTWRGGDYMFIARSSDDEWCIPVPLDEMGKWTVAAAVSVEDKRFWDHSGVDFIACLRAALADISAGRFAQGGSTITSQLVRIAIPRERTLWNKAVEFWTAVKLERMHTKREIIEAWLNRVPLGSNIRGIEAASMIYFGKRAIALTLTESAALMSMLRSPSRLRPDRWPERLTAIRDRSLNAMYEQGAISWEIYQGAIAEPIRSTRNDLPREGSFAASIVLRDHEGDRVRTTLDRRAQEALQSILTRALSDLPKGITAAAAIADNASGEIIAYVGNARSTERLSGSQFDCARALRSPGSLLKPFLYARALEEGKIEAMTLLDDSSAGFGASAPRNYDLGYRGLITARGALARSLNAPAVRVLRMIGLTSAADTLRRFGFDSLDGDPARYGDSMILGGCEISLVQALRAYTSLRRGGVLMPLKWTFDMERSDPSRPISPATAYIVTDILRDAAVGARDAGVLSYGQDEDISLKTGTSHGFRDAWCAASTSKMTAVVWFGRADGASDTMLKGQELAAPVAVDALRSISNERTIWSEPPRGIERVAICAQSGRIASRSCRAVYTEIVDTARTKRDVCAMSHDGGRTEQSDRVQRYALEMLSPQDGAVYTSLDGEGASIPLLSTGRGDQYWYLDGKFVEKARRGSAVEIKLFPGKYRVSVNSDGMTESASFEVR